MPSLVHTEKQLDHNENVNHIKNGSNIQQVTKVIQTQLSKK